MAKQEKDKKEKKSKYENEVETGAKELARKLRYYNLENLVNLDQRTLLLEQSYRKEGSRDIDYNDDGLRRELGKLYDNDETRYLDSKEGIPKFLYKHLKDTLDKEMIEKVSKNVDTLLETIKKNDLKKYLYLTRPSKEVKEHQRYKELAKLHEDYVKLEELKNQPEKLKAYLTKICADDPIKSKLVGYDSEIEKMYNGELEAAMTNLEGAFKKKVMKEGQEVKELDKGLLYRYIRDCINTADKKKSVDLYRHLAYDAVATKAKKKKK